MSVRRSPQSTSNPVGCTAGGSQPDLSKLTYDDSNNLITIRKRKQRECDCDYSNELHEFRREIMAVLENIAGTHEKNINLMRGDISEMRKQITDIKGSTQKMLSECSTMKTEISQLKETTTVAEKKIESISLDVEKLKNTTNLASQTCSSSCEQIIQEIEERHSRSKNIIVVGLTEGTGTNVEDKSSVINIIENQLAIQCSNNIVKVLRLGKYTPGKHRLLKICFDNPQLVKDILRNKLKSPHNIKIYSDQTPTQKNTLKELNRELSRRQESGEKDLIIKYVKGIPKIIQPLPKNLD